MCCFFVFNPAQRKNLDVELQVLVHGVDMVKDISGNAGNNAHQLRVVQIPLKINTDCISVLFLKHLLQMNK